jgi:ABC-type Fe3+-siderophore transport system permease subunit
MTVGSSLCFDLLLQIIEVEFFPSLLYHQYLLFLFQFISLIFEFLSTLFFCLYLQTMSFSLFFGIFAFLSILSCFFCSYILVETKDQLSENIVIAVQRNLTYWFGSILSFQTNKKQQQQHKYLELDDETNHSTEEEDITTIPLSLSPSQPSLTSPCP